MAYEPPNSGHHDAEGESDARQTPVARSSGTLADLGKRPPLFGQPVDQEAIDVRVQDGVIVVDLACKHCGYNLRTRGANDVCPECATAVSRSLRGNELEWADPDWLRNLHRGVSLKVLMFVVAIFLGGGIGVWSAVRRPAVPIGTPGFAVSQTLVAFVFATLQLAAAWLLTRPDPANPEESKNLRIIILVWPVVQILQTAMQSTPALAQSLTTPPLLLLSGVLGTIGPFAAVGCLLVYFRRLAKRGNEQGLARFATIVLYAGAFVAFMMTLIVVMTVTRFAPLMAGGGGATLMGAPGGPVPGGAAPGPAAGPVPPPIGGGMILFGSIAMIGGCSMLVVGLAYLILLDRFRVLFKKAWTAASANVEVGGGDGDEFATSMNEGNAGAAS